MCRRPEDTRLIDDCGRGAMMVFLLYCSAFVSTQVGTPHSFRVLSFQHLRFLLKKRYLPS